jgi:hypothetical protein
MPNAVKYSTTQQTGSILKGAVSLGVSGSFGPSGTTAWNNGITPQSGKYVIYDVGSVAGIPLIYAPQNLGELTRLALYFGASSGDIVSETTILQFFATKSTLMVANFDYESIVTDGLTTNLDARFVGSYPNAGTNWYDLSGNANNGSFNNGSPSFSTFDGKRSIRFSNDGKYVYSPPYDGYVLSNNPDISSSIASFTFETWFYMATSNTGQTVILSNAGGGDGYRWGPQSTSAYWLLGGSNDYAEGGVGSFSSIVGRWVQMVGVFDRANTYGNGPKVYCYINGVDVGSATVPTANNMNIGTPGLIACCGAFDGYISIIRVYNRALTSSEITQNFNAQKTYFGL